MDTTPSLVPAENTAEIQPQPRGRPFEPGQSGNPLGRPKGSRNKATLLAEALLDDEGELIVRKVIEKAVQGDPMALRICVDRLIPKRDRPVQFDMPADLDTFDGAKSASRYVVEACANGTLSPREATKVMSVVSSHITNVANLDLNEQLRALERKTKNL